MKIDGFQTLNIQTTHHVFAITHRLSNMSHWIQFFENASICSIILCLFFFHASSIIHWIRSWTRERILSLLSHFTHLPCGILAWRMQNIRRSGCFNVKSIEPNIICSFNHEYNIPMCIVLILSDALFFDASSQFMGAMPPKPEIWALWQVEHSCLELHGLRFTRVSCTFCETSWHCFKYFKSIWGKVANRFIRRFFHTLRFTVACIHSGEVYL